MPAVFASGFYKAFKAFGDEQAVGWGPTIFATLVAFVVGYLVIVWFLKLVTTKSFQPFVIYRLCFAALIAVLLIFGVLQPVAGLVS